MPAKKQFTIQVPSPCKEDFGAMPKSEKGFYCGSCEKHIVDFRFMSDEELIEHFKQNHFATSCGRFRANQLDRPFEFTPQSTSIFERFNWRKLAAAILLLPLINQNLFAQQKAKPATFQTEKQKSAQKKIIIEGSVMMNNVGLAHMRVSIIGTGDTVFTNNNGQFRFELPTDFPKDTITLKVIKEDNIVADDFEFSISSYLKTKQHIVINCYPIQSQPIISVVEKKPVIDADHSYSGGAMYTREEIHSMPSPTKTIKQRILSPFRKRKK